MSTTSVHGWHQWWGCIRRVLVCNILWLPKLCSKSSSMWMSGGHKVGIWTASVVYLYEHNLLHQLDLFVKGVPFESWRVTGELAVIRRTVLLWIWAAVRTLAALLRYNNVHGDDSWLVWCLETQYASWRHPYHTSSSTQVDRWSSYCTHWFLRVKQEDSVPHSPLFPRLLSWSLE